MAVAVVARYPDLTPETYDQVIASLDLDVNPPAGAIFHMAAEGVGGVVASVHRDPVVEVAPLHNVYAPEMFTIERMGAVSLPAHMSGASL